MSLGHLIVGAQPVSSAIVAATDSARSTVNFGDSANDNAGRNRTENHRPRYGADSQRRPYCPRPFVCRSAKTTNPSGTPRSTAFQTKSLVDSVSSTTRSSFPTWDPSRAALSSAAIKRSLGSNMRQLQGEIDGSRGMRERAHGNVIDAARRDPPHIFQG